jgi:signal transduction histidine kinase
MEGVAIRLEGSEPVRAVASPGFEHSFTAAIRVAPESSVPRSGFGSPSSIRMLGSLGREEGILYGVELPTSEGPPGMLYLGAQRPLAPELELVLLDLGAALGQLVSRERREVELQQHIEAREEALGIVVHDLRNPTAAIGVAASGLLQRLSDPSLKRSVERIRRATQRVGSSDLLDITPSRRTVPAHGDG